MILTMEKKEVYGRITGLKTKAGRLKKFNSVIDAINYLGKSGWRLVNAFPVSTGSGPMVYHYVFKKEFSKADTEE